ncbi:MAG: tetratricopeptide repeat protein [Nitrospiraceae bacterium]
MAHDKKSAGRSDKKRGATAGAGGRKAELLEEAITQMNAGKYGRSSSVLKELLALDPTDQEARRLSATLQLRIGSLAGARSAFETLATEAVERQDYWLAESLIREYLVAGPRCVPFIERLAQVLERKGDPEAAVKEYARGVEILIAHPDPEHPDQIETILGKISELEPRGRTVARLRSLIDAAKTAATAPSESSTSEVGAPASGSTPSAPSSPTLTSQEESQPAHIPAVSSSSASTGRTRLPWEDEGQEVQVAPTSAPELSSTTEAPSVPDTVATPPVPEVSAEPAVATPVTPAPMIQVSDAVTAKKADALTDIPLITIPNVVATSTPATPQSSGQPASTAPMAWEDIVARFASFAPKPPDVASKPAETAPAPVAPVASVPATVPTPPIVSSDEPLIKISADVVPTPAEITRVEEPPQPSLSLQAQDESPSPSIEQVATKHDSKETASSALSAPMPWEQVDEPIVIPAAAPSEPVSSAPVDNDRLIATILDQKDLRDTPLASLARPQAQGEPAVSAPPSSPVSVHPSQPQGEPASIRALLDSAIVRVAPGPSTQVPVAPPSVEPVVTVPPVAPPVDVVSVAPVEQAVPVAPEPVVESVVAETMVEPVVAEAVAVNESPVTEVVAAPAESIGISIAEPVQETVVEEAAVSQPSAHVAEVLETQELKIVESVDALLPTPVPDVVPVTPEPKPSAFSFFPTMLRLVGAGKDDASAMSAQSEVTSAQQDESTTRSDAGANDAPVVEEAVVSPVSEAESVVTPIAVSSVREDSAAVVEAEEEQDQADTSALSDVEPSSSPNMTAVPSRSSNSDQSRRKRRERRKRSTPSYSAPVAAQPSAPTVPTPAPVAETPAMPIAAPAVVAPVVTAAAPPEVPVAPSVSVAPVVHSAPVESVAPVPIAVPEAVAAVAVATVVQQASSYAEAPQTATVHHEERQTASAPKPSRPRRSVFSTLLGYVTGAAYTGMRTAHALTVMTISLVTATVGVALIAIGGLAVTGVMLEEQPNANFTAIMGAQPPAVGGGKSGYGTYASLAVTDLGLGAATTTGQSGTSCSDVSAGSSDASPLSGLHVAYREANPAAVLASKGAAMKDLAGSAMGPLARYRQWLGTPFEDTGYGQTAEPPCASLLTLHRLSIAETFVASPSLSAGTIEAGVARVESDLAHWRTVLRNARTVGVKTLAATAVQDDLRVLSGLLLVPDLDSKYFARIAKAAVPLDAQERSLQWPIHSEVVAQQKRLDGAVKNERNEERDWYLSGASMLPLPKQRVMNGYADYAAEVMKAADVTGEVSSMPNRYTYVHTPAQGRKDYLYNPLNNVYGVDAGPAWDRAVAQVRETEALLRLVSLQTWLRKTAQETTGDTKARVAKAGQNYYDPFTGFPMLINAQKGLLYSVGMNGRDEEGNAPGDVSVVVPPYNGSAGSGASASSNQSKK